MVNKKAGLTLFLQLKDDIEISVTPDVLTLIEGMGMADPRNTVSIKIGKTFSMKIEIPCP